MPRVMSRLLRNIPNRAIQMAGTHGSKVVPFRPLDAVPAHPRILIHQSSARSFEPLNESGNVEDAGKPDYQVKMVRNYADRRDIRALTFGLRREEST